MTELLYFLKVNISKERVTDSRVRERLETQTMTSL